MISRTWKNRLKLPAAGVLVVVCATYVYGAATVELSRPTYLPASLWYKLPLASGIIVGVVCVAGAVAFVASYIFGRRDIADTRRQKQEFHNHTQFDSESS